MPDVMLLSPIASVVAAVGAGGGVE